MQLTSQQFYLKRARGAFYSAGILLRWRPSPSLDNEQKSRETHDRMLNTSINYYLILFITNCYKSLLLLFIKQIQGL